jgi:hypothetical protein
MFPKSVSKKVLGEGDPGSQVSPRKKPREETVFFSVLSETNGSGIRPSQRTLSNPRGKFKKDEKLWTIQEDSKPLGFKSRMEATLKWLKESVNSESTQM